MGVNAAASLSLRHAYFASRSDRYQRREVQRKSTTISAKIKASGNPNTTLLKKAQFKNSCNHCPEPSFQKKSEYAKAAHVGPMRKASPTLFLCIAPAAIPKAATPKTATAARLVKFGGLFQRHPTEMTYAIRVSKMMAHRSR